ncbi:hypothetical protein OQJ46_09795 [Microbulbifer thermotolerans]|uniref:hypothetical protein n=1 Tax=Microbulbifer thermotolerans TaxID=252514 RepID=UPI00224A9A56|nr:hypothetical protein [Microbulbifer thermotolerans]MCX2783280.1 hypothetical protein [Microbulbifer thermotolerans]MCX2834047.1 hypothetical protein [Microbulbifer thermotolerans]
MRYLIPLILMCSLAGYSQAQERMRSLPSDSSQIQYMGQTYFAHNGKYYRYIPDGGYYYRVQPPRGMVRDVQPHFYRLTPREYRATITTMEDCRNWAAARASRNPAIGGKIYMTELNRCKSMLGLQ